MARALDPRCFMLAIGAARRHAGPADGGDKGGFVAGQVFRFSGFVSDEGSIHAPQGADHDLVIVTYWRSFEQHERSHADSVFKARFSALAAMCTDTREVGYDMLWQGAPEPAHAGTGAVTA